MRASFFTALGMNSIICLVNSAFPTLVFTHVFISVAADEM